MKTRASLVKSLSHYSSPFPEEEIFKKDFLRLLENPRAFFRDHLPGHITASSWIINENANKALLTHHAKLNRWLQPGGHADGDEDILGVAMKEAIEETGLRTLSIVTPAIFDLDIHPIPARSDFPAHLHYDIRVLMKGSDTEKFKVTLESHDLAWISFDQLQLVTANNTSIMRMAKKVGLLRTDQ
jgi:8-oxo-dGTP pyrophosphatase MutT (NUDIX family)